MKFKEYLNEMAMGPKELKRKNPPNIKKAIKDFEKLIDDKLKKATISQEGKVNLNFPLAKVEPILKSNNIENDNLKIISVVAEQLNKNYKKSGWSKVNISIDPKYVYIDFVLKIELTE